MQSILDLERNLVSRKDNIHQMSAPQQSIRCNGQLNVITDLNSSLPEKGRVVFVDKTNESRVIAGMRIFGTPQSRLVIDAYNSANGLGFRTNIDQGIASEGGAGLPYAFEIQQTSTKSSVPLVVQEASAFQKGPEFGANLLDVIRYGTKNVPGVLIPQTRYLAKFQQNTYQGGEQVQIGIGQVATGHHTVLGIQPLFSGSGTAVGGTAYLGYAIKDFIEPVKAIEFDQLGNVRIPVTIFATTYLNLPPVPPGDLLPITLDKLNNRVGINQTVPTETLDVVGKIASSEEITAPLFNNVPLKGTGFSIAVGNVAGTVQDDSCVAIGRDAGKDQRLNAISIGSYSGQTNQGADAIGIGTGAATSNQGANAVAIGRYSGTTTQGQDAVAIGRRAGDVTQGASAIALGLDSGRTSQGIETISVGRGAGNNLQGNNGVAIGSYAGQTTQGINCVAIGNTAGQTTQGLGAVAIGVDSGRNGQLSYAVAVGPGAGTSTQAANAVAIGLNAGRTAQGAASIAIGAGAGYLNQHANSIILNAINSNTNSTAASQFIVKPIRNLAGPQALAYDPTTGEVTYNPSPAQSLLPITLDTTNNRVGINKTVPTQALDVVGTIAASVAVTTPLLNGLRVLSNNASTNIGIGLNAGLATQGQYATAIGSGSGQTSQALGAIAIGSNSGQQSQGQASIAIGQDSGNDTQGFNSIAIGKNAANYQQGTNSIAIGASAGLNNQHANSIALNASGAPLNTTAASQFVVKPIRNFAGPQALTYDPTSGEVSYTAAGGGALSPIRLNAVGGPLGGSVNDVCTFLGLGAGWYIASCRVDVSAVTLPYLYTDIYILDATSGTTLALQRSNYVAVPHNESFTTTFQLTATSSVTLRIQPDNAATITNQTFLTVTKIA